MFLAHSVLYSDYCKICDTVSDVGMGRGSACRLYARLGVGKCCFDIGFRHMPSTPGAQGRRGDAAPHYCTDHTISILDHLKASLLTPIHTLITEINISLTAKGTA